MTVKTIAEAKAQAKKLKTALALQGVSLGHGHALEVIAHQSDARDWNTLSARLAEAVPSPFFLRQRVQGQYLGQAFKGEINALSSTGKHYSVSVRLDEPADTVTFAGFSNMRRVVRSVVDGNGNSIRKTSNGTFHLVLAPL
ncbi:glyoxalase superfamily protein [Rhizobium tumorigenes]|uniref:Glyoxalase superfamily protein n=1 Tax=Rhizobium tumorigenes TaxID=2041385 RepID=A0AAF1KAB7_9HYPH|nr:glyoxalase superfamily protein [Rhizobium tumorigenes]WFR95762.1 glyoxalase superfamily protein [Rhizobium tumorigenes]